MYCAVGHFPDLIQLWQDSVKFSDKHKEEIIETSDSSWSLFCAWIIIHCSACRWQIT